MYRLAVRVRLEQALVRVLRKQCCCLSFLCVLRFCCTVRYVFILSVCYVLLYLAWCVYVHVVFRCKTCVCLCVWLCAVLCLECNVAWLYVTCHSRLNARRQCKRDCG